jgi:hypothetical protein
MEKQTILKQVIIRKFILSTIIPSFLLAIVLIYMLINLKENSIKETHANFLTAIDKHIKSFYEDKLILVETTIKEANKNDKYLFENILKLNSSISSIIALDSKGKIKKIYSYQNSFIDKKIDFKKQINLDSFLKTKQSFFGNTYSFSDKSTNFFLPYVFESKGTIYIINIDVDYFSSYIKSLLKNNSSIAVFLVDKNNLCIVNSFEEERLSPYTLATSKAILKNNQYELIKFSDKNKTYRITYTNQQEIGWKIVVKDTYDQVLSYIQNILFFTIGFMLILLITTILIVKRFVRNIIEPVESLILEIEDFTHNIEYFEPTNIIKSKYHIFNTLIESFETMKNDIIDREMELKDLNEHLEEKTLQLEKLQEKFNSIR